MVALYTQLAESQAVQNGRATGLKFQFLGAAEARTFIYRKGRIHYLRFNPFTPNTPPFQ